MDIFELTTNYAFKNSIAVLTRRDLILAIFIFVIIYSVGAFFSKKNKKWNNIKSIFVAILFAYIYLVFMFAVFGRPEAQEISYELMPFWSYVEAIFYGKKILLLECMLNVTLFIPLGGCLAGINVKLRYAVITGILMSYAIEFSQLILHRGLFELFDDPINNILGTTLGYLVMGKVWKKIGIN